MDIVRSALVTGASRGVGRGVAVSLAAAGYQVFGTGRSIQKAALPPGVIALPCDHTNDKQTAGVFQRIKAEAKSLDLVVNCAWGGYERMIENGAYTWTAPFWQQPAHRWGSMMDAGVRAAFAVSGLAAPIMIAQKRGLIVNIGYWAARKRIGNAIYGISKAATDKLTCEMAIDLRPYGVTVVSLYPGLVRTEAVVAAGAQGWLDLSNSESPEFIGRVIAALDADERTFSQSGSVLIAAEVAERYGITDENGQRPAPLNIETA